MNQYDSYQNASENPNIVNSEFSSIEELNAFTVWSLENLCSYNSDVFDLEIRSTPTNAVIYYKRAGDEDYIKGDSPTDTTLRGLKMAVWKILVVLDSKSLAGDFDPFTTNKDQRKKSFNFTEKK